MHYKLGHLVFNQEEKNNNLSQIFISQPSLEAEAVLGKLFLVMEMPSKKPDELKLANFIATEIEKHYYENEKIILREKLEEITVEQIFESAIAKLNRNLDNFIQGEKIKFKLEGINITIGAIYKNELYFTNLGKNKALLIYQPKIKSINESNYAIIDITKKTNDSNREITSLNKLFSNVINGSIPNNGYFFFTNEALYEYLTERQIIDTITNLPPISAAEQIKQIVTKINNNIPFLALIIKNTINEAQEIITEQVQPTNNQLLNSPATSLEISQNNKLFEDNNHISKLNHNEARTESLLKPSGLVNLQQWIKRINPLTQDRLSNIKQTQSKNLLTVKTKLRENKPAIKQSLNKFIFILSIIGQTLLRVIIALTKKEVWLKLFQQTKLFIATIKKYSLFTFLFFKNLSKRNKILLAIGLSCLAIFMVNLSYGNNQKKKLAEQEAYINGTKTIEQKLNQIEASLLYNNKEAAKQSLDEVSAIMKQLPQNTEDQKNYLKNLQVKFQEKAGLINNNYTVNAPKILAELSEQHQNIVLSNNKLYTSSNTSKTIQTINTNDGSLKKINSQPLNLTGLSYPAIDSIGNVYYLNNTDLIKLDTETNQLNTLAIKNPANNIDYMTIFNNRLYLFDKTANQIFRYTKGNKSFDSRQVWLRDSTSLANLTSAAIDGQVYLLQGSAVTRLAVGQKQDFNLEAIEPVLAAPTKILASENKDYLYVLEPSQKRLVIFNKSGKYLAQYISPKFTALSDVTIDEVTKKAYLLNGNTIYELDLK